jgi:hypothetical protein
MVAGYELILSITSCVIFAFGMLIPFLVRPTLSHRGNATLRNSPKHRKFLRCVSIHRATSVFDLISRQLPARLPTSSINDRAPCRVRGRPTVDRDCAGRHIARSGNLMVCHVIGI